MDKKSGGFTLVEVIVVIAILGIIAAIAIPRLYGLNSIAEERVCATNRKTVERLYITFLLETEHGESTFNQFFIENFDVVCPVGGAISYVERNVNCSIHVENNHTPEEPPEEEVPWL